MSKNNIERVDVKIYEGSEEASVAVARRIAAIIREKASENSATVLGLATGHTPVKVYRELGRMHREENLDFSNVITFNLDEYWPISHDVAQSYHAWMHENLFKYINIPAENIHLPSGESKKDDVNSDCLAYERSIAKAGGIDFLILGIGRSGHVGFNEPGSTQDSITRRVHLDKITRMDAASDFFGEENVPEMAITMGLGTILGAKEIALLAFGEHKSPIIHRAVEGEISQHVAATYLQEHDNTTFFLDISAAAFLTRIATPWLTGPCQWDKHLRSRAVLWLAKEKKKPILQLTDEDYAESGLVGLLHECDGSYNENIRVFKNMMNTITGWPGGKGDSKKILVLSPHPDDDVISAGGTIRRLAQHGHEVHVAYMVSGFLSVFDNDVLRYTDFVRNFNNIFGLCETDPTVIDQRVVEFLHHKKPGDVDTAEVQSIKSLVRQSEAIDAALNSGLVRENLHFLNMPFYNTGTVQKLEVGSDDIKAVADVIEQVKPDMIFAAGDLSDPHGTHRLCLSATLTALDAYTDSTNLNPELWLYRGAWQEWAPEQIDMAIPLSPDELKAKRFAIFCHESQKDRAMFPGPYDSREFWQRAEDRNKSTADTYDALGLPEYHAIEAFARYPMDRPAQLETNLEKP